MNVGTILTAAALLAVSPVLIHIAPQVVGGSASYVVLSGSMAPAFHAGDFIVTSKFRLDTPVEPGDIITYKVGAGDTLVTHRVVEVQGEKAKRAFVTKGDANEDQDPNPVAATRVQGVYMFHVPYYGYLLGFAGQSLGRLLLIVIPCAAIIAMESRKVVRVLREEAVREALARHAQATPPTAPAPAGRAAVVTAAGKPALAGSAVVLSKRGLAPAAPRFQVLGVQR